jgi:hypothetical protein
MIYWFFKDVSVNKTDLPKRFLTFLQTEKRNWRKDVFYVDYETASKLVDLSKVDFIDYCTMMANFIHHNGCDIVICSGEVGELHLTTDKIMKMHLHPKKGEVDEQSYQLNLCVDTSNQSFNKLIQYINEL